MSQSRKWIEKNLSWFHPIGIIIVGKKRGQSRQKTNAGVLYKRNNENQYFLCLKIRANIFRKMLVRKLMDLSKNKELVGRNNARLAIVKKGAIAK
jgi:hypothetical protein